VEALILDFGFWIVATQGFPRMHARQQAIVLRLLWVYD